MRYTSEELRDRIMGILVSYKISSDDIKIGNIYDWGCIIDVLGYEFVFTCESWGTLLRQLWFQAIKNIEVLPSDLKSHLFKIYPDSIYDRFEDCQLATIKNGRVSERNFNIMPVEIEERISEISNIKVLANLGLIGCSYNWDSTVYIANHEHNSIGKNKDTIVIHFIRRREKLEKISIQIDIVGFNTIVRSIKHAPWMNKIKTPIDLYTYYHNFGSGGSFDRNLRQPRYSGINILVEYAGTIWRRVSRVWKVYNENEIIPKKVHDELSMYMNTYYIGN
jgi:hypothetical protein